MILSSTKLVCEKCYPGYLKSVGGKTCAHQGAYPYHKTGGSAISTNCYYSMNNGIATSCKKCERGFLLSSGVCKT